MVIQDPMQALPILKSNKQLGYCFLNNRYNNDGSKEVKNEFRKSLYECSFDPKEYFIYTRIDIVSKDIESGADNLEIDNRLIGYMKFFTTDNNDHGLKKYL
ncbi:MAG: hypothetical protein K0Q51_639 [Rickettsiaceae bacterium]|jgi:hypothetical protein|nr:hypothetical protein [Rickettsiaceae bacterium]